MSNFEAPMKNGPLDNPEWTEEQNRRFDAVEDIHIAHAARRIALGKTEEEVKENFDDSVQMPVKVVRKQSQKGRIDRPSKNHRVYDRDKSVESYYAPYDELK